MNITKVKNLSKGFTLIELLVVVLIIGVLAAVALPQYMKTLEESRASEAVQVLSSVRRDQERYYLSNLEYTNDWDKLDVSFPLTFVNATQRKSLYFDYTLITGPTYNYITAYRGSGGQNKYRFELYYERAGSNSRKFACVPQKSYDFVCTYLGGKFWTKIGELNAYLL